LLASVRHDSLVDSGPIRVLELVYGGLIDMPGLKQPLDNMTV